MPPAATRPAPLTMMPGSSGWTAALPLAVAATADGTEVGRFEAPKPLQRGIVRLRRLSRRAS